MYLYYVFVYYDFDWLQSVIFFPGRVGESLIRIENLPCSKKNEHCEANVFLKKNLELGRVYDFRLRVRDTQGDLTIVNSTIKATNGTTAMDTIFPHYTNLIVVPEVRYKLYLSSFIFTKIFTKIM